MAGRWSGLAIGRRAGKRLEPRQRRASRTATVAALLLAACGVTALPAAWAATGGFSPASGGGPPRPDLTLTLTSLGAFHALHLAAYDVAIANTGTASQREVAVRIVLPGGLVPMRAGGPGWICMADWAHNIENCQSTGALAAGDTARFDLRVLVTAHTGALLTTRATVGSSNAAVLGSRATSVAQVRSFFD